MYWVEEAMIQGYSVEFIYGDQYVINLKHGDETKDISFKSYDKESLKRTVQIYILGEYNGKR